MKIPPSILSPFLYAFYKLWCFSLRISESGRDEIALLEASGNVIVFSLWHDELFPLTYIRRNLHLITVISQSADGEYLARLQEKMGIRTVRGSSSKGGLKVLLEGASLMRRERYHCGISVDGPRGPRHTAKPGAVILAFRANARVMPVRVFMKTRTCFGSWDRFQLPWPFSRVHVAWGEPYTLDITDLAEESLQRECRRLESKLGDIRPPDGI